MTEEKFTKKDCKNCQCCICKKQDCRKNIQKVEIVDDRKKFENPLFD